MRIIMDMDEALRLIIARSPNNVQNAIRAIRTAQNRPNARPVQYVLEQALIDPMADFTPAERAGIAALLQGDDTRSYDIRLRVTAEEKTEVQRLADAAGMTVSDFIRSRIGL
jgi:hypothetical protein